MKNHVGKHYTIYSQLLKGILFFKHKYEAIRGKALTFQENVLRIESEIVIRNKGR
ncbi:hypothetical protein JCM16418A_19740 [Paenibacillus pini]